MKKNFLNRNIIFTTTMWSMVIASIAIQIYYLPLLPDRIAIHFNALGNANGWASREVLLILSISVLFFVAGLSQLMLYYLPKMPTDLINIPHKKYWLAPARGDLAIKKINRYLLWVSNLTILFLAGLFYLIAEVNYYQTYRLGQIFWILFGLYLAGIIFLTSELMIFFFKVPKSYSEIK